MIVKNRFFMWVFAIIFVAFCGWCFDEKAPSHETTFNEDVETLYTMKMLKIIR